MAKPNRNKSFFHDYTALLSNTSFGIVFSLSGTKLPSAHSTFQLPGLPLRTLSNSTCQRGKPTPGKPSSSSLGIGVICQRATQVFVFALRRSLRRINPVTLLLSTANCNRRDCAKL